MKRTQVALATLLLSGATFVAAQTTLGTGSFASSGIAIGNTATQADIDINYVDGGVSQIYSGGVAIGNGAKATGKNVVIGDGLTAPQDGNRGAYSFVIGGLNVNNGLIEYRRVVGMADGMFATDGANLGQATSLADTARTLANAYTDTKLAPIATRLNVTELTANAAYATSQGAVTVANNADVKATTAIRTSLSTQAQVAELTNVVSGFDGRISSLEDRIDGLDKRVDEASAMGAAMSNATMPSLNPGERAAVAGVGMSGGQAAAVVGMMASNYVGQVFGIKLGVVSSGKVTIGAGVGVKF